MDTANKPSAAMQATLEALAHKHGGVLKPQVVVKAAEPEKSPLHHWFQWDDSKAAHEYRLEQARRLIQVSVTMMERPNSDPVIVRTFVSLPSDRKDGGYRLLADVLSDKDQSREMLEDALAELTRLRNKYATLKELAPVFAEVDKLKKAG